MKTYIIDGRNASDSSSFLEEIATVFEFRKDWGNSLDKMQESFSEKIAEWKQYEIQITWIHMGETQSKVELKLIRAVEMMLIDVSNENDGKIKFSIDPYTAKFVLDGSKFKNHSELHKELSRIFAFPEYYGENFAATWDCITDEAIGWYQQKIDVEISWINFAQSRQNLIYEDFKIMNRIFNDIVVYLKDGRIKYTTEE